MGLDYTITNNGKTQKVRMRKLNRKERKKLSKFDTFITKDKKHKKKCTCRKCMEGKYGEIF